VISNAVTTEILSLYAVEVKWVTSSEQVLFQAIVCLPQQDEDCALIDAAGQHISSNLDFWLAKSKLMY
jgi:hypothetical protein